jgi:hypothetical protein
MPWTFTATIDHDKTDVGSVSGTYTDPADPDFAYTFQQRITADVPGLQAFKTAAEAALAERLTRRGVELSGIAWLEANMNP